MNTTGIDYSTLDPTLSAKITAFTSQLTKGTYTVTITAMDPSVDTDPMYCSDGITVITRVFTFTVLENAQPFTFDVATPFVYTSPTAANVTVVPPTVGNTALWGYEVELRPNISGVSSWSRFTVETATNGTGANTFNTAQANSAITALIGDGNIGAGQQYFLGSTGLVSGAHAYVGRIRTICNGVRSPWSTPRVFTAPMAPYNTAAPSTCGYAFNIRASSVTTNSAVIRWNSPRGAGQSAAGRTPMSFLVGYRESGNGNDPFTYVSCTNCATATCALNVPGLTQNTTYDVVVVTRCTNGAGGAADGTCSETDVDVVTSASPFAVSYSTFTTLSTRGAEATEAVANNNIAALSVYPNPNKGSFNVTIETAEAQPVTLKLTDMLGRVTLTQTVDTKAGVNEIPVKIEGYTAGIYVLQVTQGSSVRTTKVVLN
jgi:hypothetical protein